MQYASALSLLSRGDFRRPRARAGERLFCRSEAAERLHHTSSPSSVPGAGAPCLGCDPESGFFVAVHLVTRSVRADQVGAPPGATTESRVVHRILPHRERGYSPATGRRVHCRSSPKGGGGQDAVPVRPRPESVWMKSGLQWTRETPRALLRVKNCLGYGGRVADVGRTSVGGRRQTASIEWVFSAVRMSDGNEGPLPPSYSAHG